MLTRAMAQDSNAPAFPTWRDLWNSTDELGSLLERGDAALRKRARGNQRMPCWENTDDREAINQALPRAVGTAFDAVAGEVSAARPLPEESATIAKPLANFLAAQARESDEERRVWAVEEVGGGPRAAWLKLEGILKLAFQEGDFFHKFYAVTSAAMHGRTLRGVDLVVDHKRTLAGARFCGLLVLERLCDRNEEMNHLAETFKLFVRLEHAAAVGGTTRARTDSEARKAFGLLEGKLQPGTDYVGSGTAEDPFRLGPHLEFYIGSRALLQQLGVEPDTCMRRQDQSLDGSHCDRWQTPSRDYWFSTDDRMMAGASAI